MSHTLTFRNASHQTAKALSPGPWRPSRASRALIRVGNALSHKIEVLAQRLAEHRQRVENADILSDMDDRMLEDLGIDPSDMRVIIARAKRERKRVADFYMSDSRY